LRQCMNYLDLEILSHTLRGCEKITSQANAHYEIVVS
jgi:hypothetical protein